MVETNKNNPEWEDVGNLKALFDLAGFKAWIFFIPLIFSVLTAFFEGASFALLVPLIQGIFYSNFSFLNDSPQFSKILNYFHLLGNHTANREILIILGGMIFTAVLLKNITQYLSVHLLDLQVMRFGNLLRQLTFSRCLSFGKLFFDQTGLGTLNQIIMAYTQNVMGVLTNANALLSAIFLFGIYLVIMAKISWQLTLIAVCLFPLVNVSNKTIVAKIKNNSVSLAKQRRSLSDRAANIIMGIPLVKACAKEKDEINHFASLSEQVFIKEAALSKKQRIMPFIQEILATLIFLLFIFLAAYLSFRKDLQAANLMVFFLLLRRSLNTAGTFSRFKGMLAEVHAPTKEILNLLQQSESFIVPDGKNTFQGLKEKITLKNLRFSYNADRKILHDLSFDIVKGQTTAIVGRTGSGKTTVVHLLLRFYDLGSGMIFLDGEDIRNFTHESLRKKMTFVGQDTVLFHDTIRMNLTYGVDREVPEAEIQEVLKKARLDDLLQKLPSGLKTLVGDRGVQLSGGERQRLALARAMLRNTEILILDEPTSAMDSKTESKIQEAMEEAMKGKTTIVIAHRLSTIRHVDKVVLLEDGHLKEEGSFKELLARRAEFYDYWEHQSSGEAKRNS